MKLLSHHKHGRRLLLDILDNLTPSSDYARGVLDVLGLLGLVRFEGEEARAAGEVSGMVLDSLRAHLRDGVHVGLDWDDLDGEGLRGVDVLRAIESARVANVAQPTPGRIVQAVQAVIKARRGDGDLYLMQYDAHAGRFQPIGGKCEPGEGDPTETLRREMFEELGLARPPGPGNCTLKLILSDWDTTQISATYGILTQYTFAFFSVENIGFPIMVDDNVRWLTRDEIAAGRARDGRAISSIYQEALGLGRLDGLPAGVLI